MQQKKTISELYEECKKEQEMGQQLGNLMVISELFKKQLEPDFYGALIRFSPPPIPPIPQSFQVAQLNRQKDGI